MLKVPRSTPVGGLPKRELEEEHESNQSRGMLIIQNVHHYPSKNKTRNVDRETI
jgi:hypothetical protein